jgi:hypothetical protein
MIEHVFFYPSNIANINNLNDVAKAEQYMLTLLPPVSTIYSCMLAEQLVANVNNLEEILFAYVNEHLGEHHQKPHINSLKVSRTARSPKVFCALSGKFCSK